MLKAILGGKGRRLPDTAMPGDSYRSVFRSAEDLLTAAVFGRLAYLDHATSWDILSVASRGELEPASGTVELVQAEFWPSWAMTSKEGHRSVEPDVFLQFELSKPDQRVDLIVECKQGGGHDLSQWVREWSAYAETYPSEVGEPRNVRLLAVGTWGASPASRLTSLLSQLGDEAPIGFHVIPISWHGLTDALQRADVTGGDRYVVSDMLAALGLHGHRSTRPLGGLRGDPALSESFSEALVTLRSLDGIDLPPRHRSQSEACTDSIAGWPERVAERPTDSDHAVLRGL